MPRQTNRKTRDESTETFVVKNPDRRLVKLEMKDIQERMLEYITSKSKQGKSKLVDTAKIATENGEVRERQPKSNINEESKRYLRLKQVLERIPVSKSTWWAGIRKGIFPKGIKLSPRTTAWLESDIERVGMINENVYVGKV